MPLTDVQVYTIRRVIERLKGLHSALPDATRKADRRLLMSEITQLRFMLEEVLDGEDTHGPA